MTLYRHHPCLVRDSDHRTQGQLTAVTAAKRKFLFILWSFSMVFQLSGCASERVSKQNPSPSYQQLPADQSPHRRADTESRHVESSMKFTKPISSPSPAVSGVAAVTDPNTGQKTVLASQAAHPGKQSTKTAGIKHRIFHILRAFSAMLQLDDSVSDQQNEQSDLAAYQQLLADQGPQQRSDTEGRDLEQPLRLLKPIRSPPPAVSGVAAVTDPNTGQKTLLASGDAYPELPRVPSDDLAKLTIVTDPNSGKKTVLLTIEEAVARMLANSPEIRVVSFDPSIVKQDITQAAAEFDFTAFGRMNYEEEDTPPNSIFQPGQSDVRTYETGIKQRGVTGAEWSVSYALTRSWDDLVGRPLPLRYEPMVAFQLKQPLLRDAGQDVTLAGVNIAKLNYKMALLGFREKSEQFAVQVVSAYWGLVQARRELEIHQELLNRTLDTLKKVEGRRGIDATNVQIKQTESFVKIREASLLHAGKAILDAQEELIRWMADTQLNVLDEFQIIPVSEVSLEVQELESSDLLKIAMRKNPVIQQARIGIEIADINFRVAENQKMPRLDLIASSRTQGLHQDPDTSHDRLRSADFFSYAVGLSLEYPLGNRQREAELMRRRLERRKAVATLQNVADQVALAAKEGLRKIKTNHAEIQVQKEAVEAARIHLQTLKDTEPVREQLTPEFLLVKLQAQETLANTQRAENRAIVEFNISRVQLARTLGTVMEWHQIKSSLPTVPSPNGRRE